jgi:phosphosulfolactate phosphohydrolase-like enzyme
VEDYLGCGAVLSELKVDLDDEAKACREAFLAAKPGLFEAIRDSPSGRYLADRGQIADLSHCVQVSIYEVLPVIRNGKITAWTPDGAGRRD